MTVELVADAQARLGECILWCDRAEALYWTDIEGRTISRWEMQSGALRRWAMPDRVGSFALCDQGERLLLGLASGIALFDLARGATSAQVALAMPGAGVRVNDGRCDAQGRFVFGLFNPGADAARICPFFRVGPDLRIERLPLPEVCVANSIAFSPDGTRLYFADSWQREILCADYQADGRIGTPASFVRVPASQGFPDGATVDSEGGLWSAQWEGGCVVRYDAQGRESARVPLPASLVTCPAFGGSSLERLYATTARISLDEAALRAQPTAGGVFSARAGRCRGVAEHRFVCHRSS